MHSYFYGKMDFDVDVASDLLLPDQFDKARNFWGSKTSDGKLKACQELQPYLRSWFVPMGIYESEFLFPDQNDVDAFKITILNLDFTNHVIPRCEAEAWFKVKVSSEFNSIDLIEWQESNDQYFYQCISFGWEIPSKVGDANLVLRYEDHFGVDCLPNIKY